MPLLTDADFTRWWNEYRGWPDPHSGDALDAWREAVRLTAERCAAICEEECNSSCSDPFILGRASCAAAIREAAKS